MIELMLTSGFSSYLLASKPAEIIDVFTMSATCSRCSTLRKAASGEVCTMGHHISRGLRFTWS